MFSKLVASLKLLSTGLLVCLLAGCGPRGSLSTGAVPVSGSSTAKSSDPIHKVAESHTEPLKNTVKAQKVRLNSFPLFHDVAEDLGVKYTYQDGETGRALMVEATGGGAGWLDFDNDGLLDIYLCQGGNPASEDRQLEPIDQLFRQIEAGRFVPVTEGAHLREWYYGQGVSVADFDDDGFDDVFVTNVGPDTLYRNCGDGTFQDISLSAGVANPLWGSSAAWADLNGDGYLDLYVCNYVNYDPYHPIPCGTKEKPGTCHPMQVDPVPDECYFSQGDGTFAAESQQRGLFGPGNKALGVVIADFNNDGLPDVYVANDTTPNFLFINQGQGQFLEMANSLGCSVNREGAPQASMGVGFGDYDRNGWFDLYCTHFAKESNTLYKNLGPTGFQDVTGIVGLHTPTYKYLGFGTVMSDFNQDGHEDIFITNGHVDDWSNKGDLYEMEPQLFSYEGPRFVECSSLAGEFFTRKSIGRGVACGDFDNDGDWDLAVVHQNTPMAILRNDSSRGQWLKLRLIAINNRRGIGTRVVLRQGSATLTQELVGGTSYCSAHESALIFGLGENTEPCELDIRWPDGTRQTLSDVTINRELVVRQTSAVNVNSTLPDSASNKVDLK